MPMILSVTWRILLLLYSQPIELKAHIHHIIFSSRGTAKKSVRLLPYKYTRHIIRTSTYFIRAMIYTCEYVKVHIIMHRLFAGPNGITIYYYIIRV